MQRRCRFCSISISIRWHIDKHTLLHFSWNSLYAKKIGKLCFYLPNTLAKRTPKKSQVAASWTWVKLWANGDASWRKLKTWVNLRLPLARPCVHLRWLGMTCAHFGRVQICTQVDASFSPFGHPTQVSASWVPSINLLLANKMEDSLP